MQENMVERSELAIPTVSSRRGRRRRTGQRVAVDPRRLRIACNLADKTRWALSRETGVSAPTVTRIMQAGWAQTEEIEAFAKVLGVGTRFLTGEDPEEFTLPSNWPLGRRLRFARHRLGWTQDRLAEMLGVSITTVTGWENARGTGLARQDLDQLASLLNIDRKHLQTS